MLNLALLAPPQFLTDQAFPYYTAEVVTRIDKLTFTNVTAGSITVTVYIGPASTSLGPQNIITSVHSVAANATFNCPDETGHVLPIGYSMNALASANNSIVIMASGVQQS